MRFGAREAFRILIGWILLSALTSLFLGAGGAFRSEPGEDSDEAAHFVTGLMVRDYIAQGFPGSPIHFAENFYIHYPKVALGHWPPLFYLIEGLWLLVFPATLPACLALMVAVTGALAATIYRVAASEFRSDAAGAALAVLFVCLPDVQRQAGAVMLDLPVALLSLWATLAWARFSASGRLTHSLQFAVLSSCAILTKGNGLALALVPLFAMLFSRNFAPLAWRATWIGVGLIAVLCTPWLWLTAYMVTPTWQGGRLWDFIPRATLFYGRNLVDCVGTVILVFAVLGFLDKVMRLWPRRTGSPVWSSLAALATGVLLFQCVVPAGFDRRFLIGAAAPLLLMMAAGVLWTAQVLAWVPLSLQRRAQVLAVGVAVFILLGTFRIPVKYYYGFGEAAQAILRRTGQSPAVVVCSSLGNGEGMLIAALAERDKRPGQIVLRATKVLANSDWNGADYRLLKQTPEDLLPYLGAIRTQFLVLDHYPGPFQFEHHALLQRMVQEYPAHWRRIGVYPAARVGAAPGAKIELFEAVDLDKFPPGNIQLDMTRTLKKTLTIRPAL